MIINIQLTGRARQAIKSVESLGDRVAQALRTGLADALVESQRDVMENELSGQTVNARSGTLRRSVMTSVASDSTGITGFVGLAKGPADRYAAMVHEGGAIYPKKGKYLAVPLPKALTGSGVIKGQYNTNDLRSLKLACIRTKSGNLILADTTRGSMGTSTSFGLGGHGGMMSSTSKRKRFGFTPLFVLKPMVYLPSRPYLEGPADRLLNTLAGQLETKINDIIA